jgi:hypothetical protein
MNIHLEEAEYMQSHLGNESCKLQSSGGSSLNVKIFLMKNFRFIGIAIVFAVIATSDRGLKLNC